MVFSWKAKINEGDIGMCLMVESRSTCLNGADDGWINMVEEYRGLV